jgi:hypothetical protein
MKIISGLLLFHPVIIFSKVPNHTFIGGYFMIVKNLLVVGVVAGFASAAVAQDSKGSWSVGGRVRVDAHQNTKETKPVSGDKTTEKMSEVSLNRAQFTLNGARDGHGLAITYYADSNELYSAVISHKFSETVTAHFGKMKVLALGVENSYDEIDQYIMSMAGEEAPKNSTGARVDFGFGDHNVSVQAVEGIRSITNEDPAGMAMFNARGGLTTALQYRGEINKMIKPVVTYTQVRPSSTKGAFKFSDPTQNDLPLNFGNGYRTIIGVGAQMAVAGAAIDLEYDSIKNHKQKDSNEKDDDITSLVAQVKYAVGASTPFLKISSDAHKFGADKGDGDIAGMNLALGVEHALDTSCRLHALYYSKASGTKDEAGKEEKVTTTGFNFGVTASM